MFIDVHTHVFHPKIAHKVLQQLEGHYSIRPVGTGLSDDLLQQLKKASIDKAVVLSAATVPAQVIPANNWAITMKQNHEEFIPFGTIHPDFDHVEDELDRLEKNEIKGLKLHPDFQGFRMDDPALFDLMEIIQDRFICLFHVGDTLPPDKNPSCPKKMAALRKAFPKPVIIAAHMGGYQHWNEAIEHLGKTDVFVDTSSTTDFTDDALLNKLYNTFGLDRLLFGSDYPLFDASSEIDQLKSRLKLTATQFDTIMTNAWNLLFR